jgi:EAL domain-containing protein (putative c-di-GMP-specific phosphodiesterase class I)
MISQLGMSVLAEGVETKEQAEWLIDLGCDYLQGFYYSKPMPKAEFVRLIQENIKY